MKKTKIVVVFSSHLSYEENARFTEHIKDTIGVKEHKVICYENHNQFSLPELYNKALDEHAAKDNIFVFCHNDIIFRTKNWGRLLLNKFNNTDYDILGVAGSTYMPENGVWWTDRERMYGVVEHTDGVEQWTSQYSIEKKGQISPVVLIDGLFMVVNPSNLEHYFDEEFKGFHHYDTSFCLPNYLDGCNIGVMYDIRILHKSVGQTNDEWEENRKELILKYRDELPLTYEEVFNEFSGEKKLTVITRTHKRPNHFKICRESIVNQTINVNHIVGSDVECNYYDDYIRVNTDIEPDPKPNNIVYPAPYNRYLNELAEKVDSGWILYLDDDDAFTTKNSAQIILDNVGDEDTLLLWRVDINGRVVPSIINYGKIVPADISGIGFAFHRKHLDKVYWSSWSYGDYRVISNLAKYLKVKWINNILTKTQGKPNNGKNPEIQNETKTN